MPRNFYEEEIKRNRTVQLEPVQHGSFWERNWIDSNNPNYSYELDRMLHNITVYRPYIGCIVCGMPIAYQWEICDTIANSRHSDMIVAKVVPIRLCYIQLLLNQR